MKELGETERLKLELKETEEELQALYDGIIDGLLIVDINTLGVIRYNPAIIKLLGYTKDELLSINLENLFLEESYADFLVSFKTMVPGRSEFFENMPCRTKEGSKIFADIGMRQISYKGRYYNILFFRDSTERKMTREKLETSEARYRFIFNASNDLMVQIDRFGTIIDINNRVAEIAGYKPEELIGKKINSLAGIFTPASLAALVANFGKRMLGLNVTPYEVEAKSTSGEQLFFIITAYPFGDGEIAVLRDITQYRRAK